jgi:ABC-type transport system involved in cytochrome bd biosynthesis fused ATPase/permease subunit
MAVLRVSFVSALSLELLATISVALVAVTIGVRLVAGELDLERGLAVLLLAPEAYLPLRLAAQHFHASQDGLSAAARTFEILETEPPSPGARTAIPDLRSTTIRVEDLVVARPGRPVPPPVRFSVGPGETVALVGPNGAGKSTILAVLLGFVRPTQGRVVLGSPEGEIDLAELDPGRWRAQMAWVPQTPHLFAGTVAENVRIARPEATDEEVERALHAAGADFLRELPSGLATPLGDRGAGLSEGQRQRLALARAFLRDAPLVLLDEPTASLDGPTEERVLEAIRRLAEGRTVVLVAHRPSLLALADRVVRVPDPRSQRTPDAAEARR